MASLLCLCDALHLSVGDLLDRGHDRSLIRAGSYPSISFGGTRMEESLLTPFRERRLQVLHSLIHPGGGSGDETYELPTDVEFVFVVAGDLTLTIGDRSHDLRSGDAVTFSPSERHSFLNPSTTTVAEVLWVLTPALPVGGGPDDAEIEWT